LTILLSLVDKLTFHHFYTPFPSIIKHMMTYVQRKQVRTDGNKYIDKM